MFNDICLCIAILFLNMAVFKLVKRVDKLEETLHNKIVSDFIKEYHDR